VTAEKIIQGLTPFVIARSNATKQSILSFRGAMDCFASLAMTGLHGNAWDLEHRQ
jgi:hypothetical protein